MDSLKSNKTLFVIPTAEGIPSEESGDLNLLNCLDFRFHGNDNS